MAKRRSRGDGGLHWDDKRQRWIASVTVGYTPAGKRIVRKASGKTKTEAKNKLKEILRDHDDGFAVASHDYTVADAVHYWLDNGLKGRDTSTIELYRGFAETHVIPSLGARKLRDLSVEDVDGWLSSRADVLSTRSLKLIHSVLNRSVKNAMRRDKVKRNVVDLCDVPEGRRRPTLQSAHAQPGRSGPEGCSRGSRPHACVHRALSAHRSPHGGTAGTLVVARGGLRQDQASVDSRG
ncbi:hypothetical protein GCM10029978_119310 [Actinoallomurus acanthiterrae]